MELAVCLDVGDEVFLVNIVVCLAYIRVAGWGGGWGCSCYCGLVPDANRVVGSCVKAERGSYFVDKSTGWLWVGRRTSLFYCPPLVAWQSNSTLCVYGWTSPSRGGHKPPQE